MPPLPDSENNSNDQSSEETQNDSDKPYDDCSLHAPDEKEEVELESGLLPVLQSLAPKNPVPSLAEVTRAVTKLQNDWRGSQLGSLCHAHSLSLHRGGCSDIASDYRQNSKC